MILFGEDALRRAVHEFVAHYHFESHQSKFDNCRQHHRHFRQPLLKSPLSDGICEVSFLASAVHLIPACYVDIE
jgi:hypothetical protein